MKNWVTHTVAFYILGGLLRYVEGRGEAKEKQRTFDTRCSGSRSHGILTCDLEKTISAHEVGRELAC